MKNPTANIKKLNFSDKESLLLLLQDNRERLLDKANIDVLDHHKKFLDLYLEPNPNYHLYGSYNLNSELLSTFGIYIWKEMPIATILFMMTKPEQSRVFNPIDSGLMMCADACYELCESKGVFTFYSFQPVHKISGFLRQWKRHQTPRLARYISYTEATIPANTKPEWPGYWEIIDQTVWPYDVEIRCTTLKPEYRTNLVIR